LRQVDLGAFVNAGTAIAVMCYAGSQLSLAPTFGQVFAFLILCAGGLLVHYSLMFLLTSVSFWTVKAQGIVWGYYNLFNLARLPDAAFRGGFKVFFTFVLPMLLVSNVPAKVIIKKLSSPGDAALLLLLAAICFVVSEFGWRRSVRRYTSASS
jgi:ABC-2 type transport system permease protein